MEKLSIDEAIAHAREVANTRTDLCDECRAEHRQLAEWLEQLKVYRDLAEQGRLLVLPCAVGDTVYILAGRFGTFYEEDICDGFYIGRDNILQIKVKNDKGNHGTYGLFGKTVFLTKEEAEAALEKMKGEEHETD